MPKVTIMGDQTGGGSGMPFTSELPNGWGVRFSACPTYDAEMNQIEFGIEPDIAVALSAEDQAQGIDTIIEAARVYLNKKP
jgi:C-terminal processing protease CtpA/Prc